ncbi:MAG: DNA or RNA helicase of superfamily II [Nitrospira sp. CR2.1]|nr:DNA or RNA helicase of superfamily II [Nitrospira sp. CR2.1]
MTPPDEDPARCPLCSRENKCGLANGSKACWCFDSPIPSKVLTLLPVEMKGVACICRDCAWQTAPRDRLAALHDCVRKWR